MERENKPKTERVYKDYRLNKSSSIVITYVEGTNSTFKLVDPKTNKEHYVTWNRKLGDWACDCWHYANRTAPNKRKYGYCSHIMAMFFKYNTNKFTEEIKRERFIYNPLYQLIKEK